MEVCVSTQPALQEDTEELLAEMRGVLTGQARVEPCGDVLAHTCAHGHKVQPLQPCYVLFAQVPPCGLERP